MTKNERIQFNDMLIRIAQLENRSGGENVSILVVPPPVPVKLNLHIAASKQLAQTIFGEK